MDNEGIDLATSLTILDDPQSVEDLHWYFAFRLSPDDVPPFTGGRFDRLGGGGDRPEVRDMFTAADLIAVQILSVHVPPKVALDLLEGSLRRAVSAKLRAMPTDVDLGAGRAAGFIADDSPANQAWDLLADSAGVGWVIAGKLLARKRPRLIPAYDDVVRCAYRTSDDFWLWLDGRLREDGGVLRRRLEQLRTDAALSNGISALILLDVVMWMRHRPSHVGYRCRGLGESRGDKRGPEWNGGGRA